MKFKNIKKKAYKKRKFPSNSRSIPEHIKSPRLKLNSVSLFRTYRRILKAFVAILFVIAVVIVSLDIQENLGTKQNIDYQRLLVIRELKYWQDFISKNNAFRDAYFQASVLEYKLGEISMAKKYLEKGLSLDPNSKEGIILRKFILDR